MLAVGALLMSLSVLTVRGNDPTTDVLYIDYDYPTDGPFTFDTNDWLIDLLDFNDLTPCDPNPCFNGGSCQSKFGTEFECLCIEPYIGKCCQKVRNICENVRCGHGDCVVNPNKNPFYECKCHPPYRGPNCTILPASACDPNPCQNGGLCISNNRRFRCACPDGYSGRFCGIAPTDCYEGNGETYRGVASATEGGVECLNWHSNFIVAKGDDPFQLYSDFKGLEYNNHCRNPDGDDKPWCYIKNQTELEWDYCKVKKCPEGPTSTPSVIKPVPGSQQFSQCGISRPSRTSRIFGGTKSLAGTHPWQASVQVRPKGSSFGFRHYCGGILLSSCWVLTAAHCVDAGNEYQVVLGGVNINKDEAMDQTIPVKQIIVHENYRETASALYNDIALLELKVMDSPYCAKETDFVKTVCLPEQTFPSGTPCKISGWGATPTQRISQQLLDARVLLISEEKCKAPHVYGNVLDRSMLCAGTLQGGIDSCQGDSGGPLVCKHNGTHYITGVVSWGDGCGEKNKPGVYANVHTFIDWIKSRISPTTDLH